MITITSTSELGNILTYISPEKQKEVAKWFLAFQGRECKWSSLEKKKNFVEGKARIVKIEPGRKGHACYKNARYESRELSL